MGRFASTVEFYSRYREPYPATFFKTVAEQLALRGNEALLDIGCGPGLLAIGFAPFVGLAVGLDPEVAMIQAAEAAAAELGVAVRLIQGRIEEFSTASSFDILTIGRALHWLDRHATLPVLESIVPDSGRILICGVRSVETPVAPWVKSYKDARRLWISDADEKQYRVDAKAWFAGSYFGQVDVTSATECRPVTVAELVRRALSKSSSSPEKLGQRRQRFEAELIGVLEPFAQDGVLQEQVVAEASIFARLPRRNS